MIDTKKLQKWIDAINSYYAFALLVYAAILFVFSNTWIFLWIFVVITPLLAGWTGYLLRGYVVRRTQRYGFRMLSEKVTYEINPSHKYTLHYDRKIKAMTNNLMVYPIGYIWSGKGDEELPRVTGEGRELLVSQDHSKRSLPYRFTTSQGEWHYWFISLNPSLHKDDVTDIQYSQNFVDKKHEAKPYLRYFVRVSMETLELNVKFSSGKLPRSVIGGYFKPSDPTRFYTKAGVQYNADKQWATWTIDKPKRGYCYQIGWQ